MPARTTGLTGMQNHTAMNYVVTGSLGHIGKPLASQLVHDGHSVTVISSNPARKAQIESMGAYAAIGTVEDVDFLSRTFRGADAIFTMVPPNFAGNDWKGHIAHIGENYARAIAASGVGRVVNLSSIGAHLIDGCGPVNGLHRVETILNELQDVQVRHLRAAYFYTNFLNSIDIISKNGFLSGNFGENTLMVLVHPLDIADEAAKELRNHDIIGRGFRYIASDEKTTGEIATIIGKAIEKPDLRWIDRSDKETCDEMIRFGIPEEIAKNYTEMGAAMRDGSMTDHYFNNRPVLAGWRRLETFAPDFATAYFAS